MPERAIPVILNTMLSITVTGNVASDPRTNTVSGTEVTNFTILSNSKSKGEDVTSAVDVSVWGKRAEVAARYIKKGSLVTVAGTGHIEIYEGKSGPGAKIAMQAADFTLPPKPKADDL
jgi:single-strand DNA-binding protein